MTVKKILVSLLMVPFLFTYGGSQEIENKEIKNVVLVINSENPHETVVVGDNGEWLFDAKIIKIEIDVVRKTSSLTCTMWKGVFRPTKPENKSWTIAEIMWVNKQEFQQIVDGLQTGSFIKNIKDE